MRSADAQQTTVISNKHESISITFSFNSKHISLVHLFSIWVCVMGQESEFHEMNQWNNGIFWNNEWIEKIYSILNIPPANCCIHPFVIDRRETTLVSLHTTWCQSVFVFVFAIDFSSALPFASLAITVISHYNRRVGTIQLYQQLL